MTNIPVQFQSQVRSFRCAAAVPRVHLGNPVENYAEHLACFRKAEAAGCDFLCFPYLSLTGSTCGDLFRLGNLHRQAEAVLSKLLQETRQSRMRVLVGMQLTDVSGTQMCPGAVLFQSGRILSRFFCGEPQLISLPEMGQALLLSERQPVPDSLPENCSLLVRMAAFPSLADQPAPSDSYTEKELSAPFSLGVSAGYGESSGDSVYGGGAWLVSRGRVFARAEEFSRENQVLWADVCPGDAPVNAGEPFPAVPRDVRLPFLPEEPSLRSEWCRRALRIQACGLAQRMECTRSRRLVLGLSGGLDSTIAMLACAECCDFLQIPRSAILALTMPGMGTSGRTRGNACQLAEDLGAELREIDIRPAVMQHFRDIGHEESCLNVVYENAQARERTQILMDLANEVGGLLVGTGDMSEIALGWCTYNGDHMAMYGVNAGLPKSVLRAMAETEAARQGGSLAAVLRDINATPVSPELLPGAQETESIIGNYDLHDLFLFHLLQTPMPEVEQLRLAAENALGAVYSPEKIRKTLGIFLKRFFSQQFKRNAAPDAPQIFSVGLSSRNGWRMPSDVSASWLAELLL